VYWSEFETREKKTTPKCEPRNTKHTMEEKKKKEKNGKRDKTIANESK